MEAGPEELSGGRSWLHLPRRSPGAVNSAGPREHAPLPGGAAWEEQRLRAAMGGFRLTLESSAME